MLGLSGVCCPGTVPLAGIGGENKHPSLHPSQQLYVFTVSQFRIGDTAAAAAAAAKSLQLCLTLCDPIDGSPPGCPVPGIFQARTLDCVDISFSNAWKWKAKAKSFSRVQLFAAPWIAAYQAPPSMGFSRQEYWIGVPLPSPNMQSLSKFQGMFHKTEKKKKILQLV